MLQQSPGRLGQLPGRKPAGVAGDRAAKYPTPIPCIWPMYPASDPSKTQEMEHFVLRIRRQSSDFHHFSGPSEYVHGLQRIETQASRMQNSPAMFAAAKCQISEIAGPNPTSHNTCTGCRESHQAALVHAPCALSRINRTHRRPPGPHHKAPPRDLESLQEIYSRAPKILQRTSYSHSFMV